MSTSVRTVKKCPTFMKEVITFNKKGKKVVKSVEVSDYFLVILNNGNSIAVSAKDLERYGITDIKIDDKSSKVVEVSEEVEDNDDDLDEVVETVTETETEGPSLVNGSTN
jgi:PHD/YefM family antitoxin component YafN of YafNO toxin-antitoxin module